MGTRRLYLLTRLPPLPAPGGALPITLPEALALLREVGGRDFERLADALGAEAGMRDALEEWVLGAPGSRLPPAGLPPAIAALFDEERAAGLSEGAWVDTVWEAWFALLAEVGRDIGSRLLPRWADWEMSLRRGLARSRGLDRDGPPPADGGREGGDGPRRAEILAQWDSVRERGRAGKGLAEAMEAEGVLERARLEYLRSAAAPYSFTVDEVAAYFLALRLLDRQRRLDPGRGRAMLREAAAP